MAELSDADQVRVDPSNADVTADKTWFHRHLVHIALALALLPLVVSAITLVVDVGNSYLPTSDRALTELHVRDVGHHAVLVGLYSRADWSHPGPIQFYLLAPIYWVTGGASIAMNLGSLLINGAAIAGMALIARRRGGTRLMLCTLIGCGLLTRTLSAEFIRDPWNNFITVLPFGLMVFLAWTLACGDTWALPVAALVASFLAETHVGFVALALPLLAWGLAWLMILRWRSGDHRTSRSELIRSGLCSVALLALVWLPTLVDVVVHGPSNATKIVRWFRQAEGGTHTLAQGWRIISGQFALRPEWMTRPRAPFFLTGEPIYVARASTPWFLLLLVPAAWVLWRRHRGDGWRLVLTLGIAMALGILAVARTVGPAFDYRLRWTWVLAMVGFVVIAWAGWLEVADRWPKAGGRWLTGVTVTVLLVLSAANVVSGLRAGTPEAEDSATLGELTPAVLRAVGRGPGDVVLTDSATGSPFTRGLVLQLERHGIEARVPPVRAELFGANRVHRKGHIRARLVVAANAEVAAAVKQPRLRLLARSDSISVQKQAEVAARLAALDAERKAGRLTTAGYLFGIGGAQRLLRPRGLSGVYAVAVFLDESGDR